jgi:hypothetical protein
MESQEEINTVIVRLLDKKKIIRTHYGGSYPPAFVALLLPDPSRRDREIVPKRR